MKRKFLVVGAIFFVAGFLGLGAMKADGNISSSDLYQVSRRSKYEAQKVTLTKSQQEKISQMLGGRIPVEEVIKYYKAKKWKGQGISGNIFGIDGKNAHGPYKILVLIQGSEAAKLILDKSISNKGNSVINQEFLNQFVGKSLAHSFEIARTLDDVMHIPAKIRSLANEVELSNEIALKIKKVLAEAAILSGGQHMTLNYNKNERKVDIFHHYAHQNRLTCNECHHKNELEKAPRACKNCHGDKQDGKKPGIKDAMHKRCRGCHEEKKQGPAKCEGCHGRE